VTILVSTSLLPSFLPWTIVSSHSGMSVSNIKTEAWHLDALDDAAISGQNMKMGSQVGRLMLYATCSSVFVVCHFLVAVVDFVYSGKTTACVGEGNFTKVFEKKALP
jgi:hypothetical protein